MPVLTCPFVSIPAQELPAVKIGYPAKVLLSTELSIKPVAGETWSVEGLSLRFTTNYLARYYVNIKASYKALQNAKLAITKQEAALLKVKEQILNQISNLESTEIRRDEIYKAEPTAAHLAEREEAQAAVRAAYREREALAETQEGYVRDKQTVERELNELGKPAAREGIRTAPLIIIARLYARGNELVWNSQLTPVRFLFPTGFTYSEGEGFEVISVVAKGEWNEILDDHIQFQDPIDFTERENLRLVLEFAAPKEGSFSEEVEGPEALSVSLSQVQAIVNYSREMAT